MTTVNKTKAIDRSSVGHFLFLMAFAISILALPNQAEQKKVGGTIRNFKTRADAGENKYTLFNGTEAKAVSGDTYEITAPHLTTFQSDDRPEMTIDSPKCLYNTETKVASSSSELSVKTADDKFSIKGLGWLWLQNDSVLTISNKVEALIRKSAILTNRTDKTMVASNSPGKTPGTNTTVKVTSQQFVHRGNIASFVGDVLVEDGADMLRCEVLNVEFQEGGGATQIEANGNVILSQLETEVRAGKAFYSVAENLIQLSEKPVWHVGAREGSSELLTINRTNNSFHAEQNVYMKLSGTNGVSDKPPVTGAKTASLSAQTNQVIEIYSDLFDYLDPGKEAAAGTAFYQGNVRVHQSSGELHCKFLTVLFSPKENRLLKAIAEDNVELINDASHVSGEKAIYEFVEGKITLSGNPRWVMEERKGSSDYMILYPRTEELLALQKVHLVLPSSSTGQMRVLGQASTNRPSPAISSNSVPMEIFADMLSRQGTVSVFRDNVHIHDSQGDITCAMLTVVNGASNQIQRIVADQKVEIRQEKMLATGDKAVYNLDTGTIELFGQPKITTPEQTVAADFFLINRDSGTFQIHGKYRIEMKSPKKPGKSPLLSQKASRKSKPASP